MKIAILGWGSLIWDSRPEFDEQHDTWYNDGPTLNLEFSRVSRSRGKALTLVIDSQNGSPCNVAYTFSKRKNPDDVICDLRCREETTLNNVGFYFADGSRMRSRDANARESIHSWATAKRVDVVVWTDLISNFATDSLSHQPFSVLSAISHIQALDESGKAQAVEYIWRAPIFVDTWLRRALQSEPWFQRPSC